MTKTDSQAANSKMPELPASTFIEEWTDADVEFWTKQIELRKSDTPWNDGLHAFIQELHRRIAHQKQKLEEEM